MPSLSLSQLQYAAAQKKLIWLTGYSSPGLHLLADFVLTLIPRPAMPVRNARYCATVTSVVARAKARGTLQTRRRSSVFSSSSLLRSGSCGGDPVRERTPFG